MSLASVTLKLTPQLQYVLRLGDTCLIHAQRLGEWSGHGPVLEEDIAITNLALDLLGQARGLLSHAAALDGHGLDEDDLAFLRDERQFFNLSLVEQPSRRSSAHAPGGDFADLCLRNLLLSAWLKLMWQGLASSSDPALAAIAGKAVKEASYHLQHAADWVVRLGDGTAESHARLVAAIERAWPFVNELFAHDAVDAAAEGCGLGPTRQSLHAPWLAQIQAVFAAATVALPPETPSLSTGCQGVHSEHMGFILAEMQSLQRSFPGGVW
jgi:ring-1,2-phenylacetyl-CoA epoxidase subunit PaaC